MKHLIEHGSYRIIVAAFAGCALTSCAADSGDSELRPTEHEILSPLDPTEAAVEVFDDAALDSVGRAPAQRTRQLEQGPVLLSRQLRAQLPTASESVKTRIFLTPDTVADDGLRDEGSVAFSEAGELIDGTLEQSPADRDSYADFAHSFQQRLARNARQRAERQRVAWLSLADQYGLSAELAEAAERGSENATVELPAHLARALAEDRSGLVRAIEHDVEGKAMLSLSDTLANMELSTRAFPRGDTGAGLGIFLTDFNGIDTERDCMDPNRVALVPGTDPNPADHATLMTCLLQQAAPEATVLYWTAHGACGSEVPDEVFGFDQPIYVSSQSDNWDGEGQYVSCDGDFDNRILNTRIAHFNSTGNSGSNVASPAVAYNVISVGAYDPATNITASFSNFIDPATLANKPEVVAPGVDIDVSPSFVGTGGTSVAAPLAAAFATDLMDHFSFLRGRPALLKAYLMANGARLDSDGAIVGDHDGTGRLDYGNALSGAARWWETENAGTFTADSDGDGRLETSYTRTLDRGTFNAVVSWLVDGTYAAANGGPNMDIDMTVFGPSGEEIGGSSSGAQSYEAVRFTAPETGSYTFRIERFSNSGVGKVVMGLVVRRR